MSLIYTCELCGANPFDYLTELQRHADQLASDPQHWMPWNYRSMLDGITPPSGPTRCPPCRFTRLATAATPQEFLHACRKDAYEWAASTPSRHIACKLMWDHTADVTALMQDFHEEFFGPAAEPMSTCRKLHEAILQ